MFRALGAMLRRWFGGDEGPALGSDGAPSEGAPSALEVMQAMKAERAAPADEDAWARGVATLKSRVFSGTDRSRLWRRARRRHPGEVVELELVTRPDTHDLAALEDLLRELERA